MTNTTPMVEIENISKTFVVEDRKPVKALQNVTNHVEKGEVLVVIGPSGSGKSTLLRTLNGLETVDTGRIVVNGVDVTDPKTNMNRLRQEIGMVFQHFNLFEHKTALENLTLPQIVVRNRSREESEPGAPRADRDRPTA